MNIILKYQAKIVLTGVIVLLTLQFFSCENCDDDGIFTSIEGQTLGINFIDVSTGQYVIQNNNGNSGIYNKAGVAFYDADQNQIDDIFTIDNGVIYYTVPTGVNLQGELAFSYFIQFDPAQPLQPFELEFIVIDSECQAPTLVDVDFKFQGSVNNLVDNTVIRIAV